MGVMSNWLARWTVNPVPFGRVGSRPTAPIVFSQYSQDNNSRKRYAIKYLKCTSLHFVTLGHLEIVGATPTIAFG